jgi:hypothetical protein
MYLYVWITGETRTVQDNISTGDILGVSVGTLKIFKYTKNKFLCLVVDEIGKLSWIEVLPAKEVKSKDVKLHHP